MEKNFRKTRTGTWRYRRCAVQATKNALLVAMSRSGGDGGKAKAATTARPSRDEKKHVSKPIENKQQTHSKEKKGRRRHATRPTGGGSTRRKKEGEKAEHYPHRGGTTG